MILTSFRRFDYLLISHFLLNLQDLPTVTTNGSASSRPSFVQSNPSTIRFNRVLGNIGAPLHDGLDEFEEDEDVHVMIGRRDAEILEGRRSDAEEYMWSPSIKDIHGIVEECVAGPSRLSAGRV